jgi:hypothetical protein
MDDSDEIRRMNLELRNEHWKIHWQFVAAQYERMSAGLGKAINSTLLLNGGTGAALLGFIGSVAKESSKSPIDVKFVFWALLCFGVGLLISCLGTWFVYKMNANYGLSESSTTIKDTWQYVDPTPESLQYRTLSNSFLRKSFCCFYGAIGAYIVALTIIAAGLFS